jgi:TolB-like protein/Tfp pilus assembly protein PilF
MSLFTELKRRRVFRAVTVYAVVAWAMIEVADVVAPHIGLPSWAVTLVIFLAAIGLPIVLVLAWLYDVSPEGVKRSPTPTSASRPVLYLGIGILIAAVGLAAIVTRGKDEPAEAPAAPESIAVLPFVNMSADPEQEYFSDGLTEELLNALAQIPTLHVAARTSSFAFKGKNVPVADVAKALNVRTVLEGSVRKAGNQVRITAQLINAEDGYHLWSQQFDRELNDIFAIQGEIGQAITTALKTRLDPGASAALAVEPHNLDAYNRYLQARFFWNQRKAPSLARAQKLLEQAIAIDPQFARAHAALADVYMVQRNYLVMPATDLPRKARAAAWRALELDSTLAEPHATLGLVHQHNYEWDSAELEFQRAIEKNPRYASAHQWYAWLLSYTGRPDQALTTINRAQELDPLSLIINENKGEHLLNLKRYDEAIAQLNHTLEIDSTFGAAVGALTAAYSLKGDHANALRVAGRARTLTAKTRFDLGWAAYAYARAGQRQPAHRILAEMRKQEFWANMAPAYVALGDYGRAAYVLDRAYEQAEPSLPDFVTSSPATVLLLDHPRVQALRRRMNLR